MRVLVGSWFRGILSYMEFVCGFCFTLTAESVPPDSRLSYPVLRLMTGFLEICRVLSVTFLNSFWDRAATGSCFLQY